jgi:putative ABC transport system permease protein
MNVVSRGVRNAFRNYIRTVSIVIIIGLSIGLSLSMLVARQAVSAKITSVNASVGNTITIAPAGYSGFSSVNNSLTTSELSKVSALAHVTNVTETLTGRLTTIGSTTPSFGNQSSSSTSSNNTTSLTSPVTLNSTHVFSNNGGTGLPSNFSLPITIVGTTDPTDVDSTTLHMSSGTAISGTSTADDALISSTMASKNSLRVGSTFTAYGTTMTVVGIYSTTSTSGTSGDVIISLPTEQSLSGQSGDVTSAVATIDSLTNLTTVTTAIKNALGSSADITNSVQEASQTIQPLNNIKTITLYSLIGAIIAGSVIILLVMVMIVRERRREIGVLKAIGASNLKVMWQFMTEAVTLTILGAIIGIILGAAAASPITKILVNNSTTTTSTTLSSSGRGGGFGGGFAGGGTTNSRGNFAFRSQATHGALRGVSNSISNLHTVVGFSIILYGLGAAIVIAILGSTAASLFISKVRPAEVMRVE